MTIIAPMILAFDTSTAACTAALFDGTGACVAKADELIGRGHSERLVPMIEELLQARSADRLIVGIGPGSFTGIRVAIAAAQGLSIGWDAQLVGMSSLALLASGIATQGEVAAAVIGGHGELFIQQFDAASGEATSELINASPTSAAALTTAQLVVGSGATQLVEARGWGEAREGWPSAAAALKLPEPLRTLPAKPMYARAPDAKARAA